MTELEQAFNLLPYSLKHDPIVVAMHEAAVIQLHEAYEDALAIYDLVQIDKLPESLLDLISYEKHVDFYDHELSTEQKRELIKTSVSWHRKKGTRWAVEKIVSIVFPETRISEWFEYGGNPYFFKLSAFVEDKGLNEATIQRLLKLVFETKNLRSWLEYLEVYLTSRSNINIATCTLYGEEITVFPWQVTNIVSNNVYYLGSAQQTFDTTTVYPKEV